MSAVADKLDEARALIERGWCQKAFTAYSRQYPETVCYCLYGAINAVVLGDAEADDLATIPHENALARVIGYQPANMASWNDAPERTQAEVVEAFRKAAELARAGDL